MTTLKLKQHHFEFNKWYDLYLDKFGKNSLNRVITHDPVYFPYYTENEIKQLIKPLKKAIETNTPIEQGDPEVWKKIRF